MILNNNDKVMIVHRRLYETDHARVFIGVVDGHTDTIIKVCGHSWVKNQYGGNYIKKNEERTKIISLSSGTLIIYQIPTSININKLHIDTSQKGESVMKDGEGFEMDLSESYPQVTKRAGDNMG